MSLGPREPGVRVAFGMSGSGKSHWLTRSVIASVRDGVRVIVIDPEEDWQAVPEDLEQATDYAPSVEAACARFKKDERMRILIVRPEIDRESEAVEAACAWALRTKAMRGVVIHEAWSVAPAKGRIPPSLLRLTRVFRHWNALLWVDTPRPSDLSRNLREVSRETHIFAIAGDADLEAVRDLAGSDGSELVAEVQRCAVLFERGEPGWQVELGKARMRPAAGYKMARTPA